MGSLVGGGMGLPWFGQFISGLGHSVFESIGTLGHYLYPVSYYDRWEIFGSVNSSFGCDLGSVGWYYDQF